MNWIAKPNYLLLAALSCICACGVPATEAVSSGDSLEYAIRYEITPKPGFDRVDVSMQVEQNRDLLREVRFRNDGRISNIEADGNTLNADDEIVWRPSSQGGLLQWSVQIGHQRGGEGYDAWLGEDWGIFRAEDVIPRAATRTLRGAFSDTRMQFVLPRDWSAITAYAADDDGDSYTIDKPRRRFDQPDGWIAVGELGIRRETIAGVRVAVAGPVGQSLRRMDTLALLNWTLPELARMLPVAPERLTVVSAGSPMWRGGLSAPNSLYMHADRPMISENATSTLLHEVMHSTLRISAREGYDWIVEGIAEYYSLELLRRSGTITESRFEQALQQQRRWSESADTLCQHASQAATTALAVVIMSELDAEIRERSAAEATLDDLVNGLLRHRTEIDLQTAQEIAAQLGGAKSDVLDTDGLPGCRSIEPGAQETS